MKILGLEASYRKLGNSDLLLRIALRRAKELGADVYAIRLPEYIIKPCKACYHCFWEECNLNDDANWILNQIVSSDALIISTPTYVFAVPGILKLLIDRVLCLYSKAEKLVGKPAAIIVTYGIEGWSGNTLSTLSAFLLSLGFHIVDRIIVRAAWPGEVLLNKSVIQKAKKVGEEIANSLSKELKQGYTKSEYNCPLCGADTLMILPNCKVKCIYCDLVGELLIKDGKVIIKFPERPYKESRWSKERRNEHIKKILNSIDEYLVYRDKVSKLIANYKEFDPYIKRE